MSEGIKTGEWREGIENRIPDDIRRKASHLATLHHQRAIGDDLATIIAKALAEERLRCANIAAAVPLHLDRGKGLVRRATREDICQAIMQERV